MEQINSSKNLCDYFFFFSYGNGSIMIGFSNGYFVVISTRKDEHGQVYVALGQYDTSF